MTRDASREAARAAETVARHSYGRLLAWAAARTRDVAAAEDALAEAFRLALEHWPRTGIPANPEGWLAVTARRAAFGRTSRRETARRGEPELLRRMEERMEAGPGSAAIPDERLQLLFVCAHPAIDARMHAPLMLQTVLGFDAAAIGAACLVPGAAMGQRLVRAKTKIRDAGIPFAVPGAEDLPARLPPVLDAVYAAFGLSWDRPGGRRDLAEEAIWLARLVTSLLPGTAEAEGLLALLLFSHARRTARRDASGAYVPLDRQDCALWDARAMAEAEDRLARAALMRRPGRFQIEAAIQAVHAERRRSGRTDWSSLATLYHNLNRIAPSLAALCGEAATLTRLGRPEEALALLDRADDRRRGFQPWWATRAEALRSQGHPDAALAFAEAIALTHDPAVRDWLGRRSGGG